MTGKRSATAAICSACFALALLAPATLAAAHRRVMNAHVPILSFASVEGEYLVGDPGRFESGGLSRRVALLNDLVGRYGDVLHLDAGSFSNCRLEPGNPWNCPELLWACMASMGVAATTPGSRDLEDWKGYQPRIQSGLIPVVTSNLLLSQDGADELVGQSFIVREVNGIQVAIFGLIDQATLRDVPDPIAQTFRVLDPVATSLDLVPRMRRSAEVVVLLSQIHSSMLSHILTTVPGIDVAIDGCRPGWVAEPSRVGSTWVQQTGIRGQYAGVLHIIVAPNGQIIDVGSENRRLDFDQPKDPETEALCKATHALRTGEPKAQASSRNSPTFRWRDPANGWAPPMDAKAQRRREATPGDGSRQ